MMWSDNETEQPATYTEGKKVKSPMAIFPQCVMVDCSALRRPHRVIIVIIIVVVVDVGNSSSVDAGRCQRAVPRRPRPVCRLLPAPPPHVSQTIIHVLIPVVVWQKN